MASTTTATAISTTTALGFFRCQSLAVAQPGLFGDNDPSVPREIFLVTAPWSPDAPGSNKQQHRHCGVGFKSKLLFTKHYSDDQPDNATSYSSNTYFGVLYVPLTARRSSTVRGVEAMPAASHKTSSTT